MNFGKNWMSWFLDWFDFVGSLVDGFRMVVCGLFGICFGYAWYLGIDDFVGRIHCVFWPVSDSVFTMEGHDYRLMFS